MRLCLLLALFLPAISSARVFSYKDGGVAAYVRGTGGLVALNQDAFANSSGNTAVDGKSTYDYGGEIGFLFSPGPMFHVRIGAEIIEDHPVIGNGLNAAGAEYYSINSSVFIFNPNVTFEYVYNTMGSLRIFGEAGVGYATVNVTNAYKMTTAGTTALGGVTDFTETLTGHALSATVGLGLENLFTDNVTLIADVGYRYLPVTSMNYGSDVKNILKPSGVSAGDAVVNSDGSNRKLNLGGVYAGVAFRFYLNFF